MHQPRDASLPNDCVCCWLRAPSTQTLVSHSQARSLGAASCPWSASLVLVTVSSRLLACLRDWGSHLSKLSQVQDESGATASRPRTPAAAAAPSPGIFWLLDWTVAGSSAPRCADEAGGAGARQAPRVILALPMRESEIGEAAAGRERAGSCLAHRVACARKEGAGEGGCVGRTRFGSLDASSCWLDAGLWSGAGAAKSATAMPVPYAEDWTGSGDEGCPFLVRAEWCKAKGVEAFWACPWNRLMVSETAEALVAAVAAHRSIRLALGRFLLPSAREEGSAQEELHGHSDKDSVSEASWEGCHESDGWRWGPQGLCQGPLMSAIQARLRHSPHVIEHEGAGTCACSQARIRPGQSTVCENNKIRKWNSTQIAVPFCMPHLCIIRIFGANR